jgi:tetratricopeptide (TPR) repeat protein/uncharacterized protein YgiM (DUF1202 family)
MVGGNWFFRAALSLGLQLLPIAALAETEFKAGTSLVVQGTNKDDQLNLRAEAAAASKSLAELPPDATGIVATGRSQMNGPDRWIEVRVGGQLGWVHSRYVRAATAKAKSKKASNSGETSEARDNGIDPQRSPPTEGDSLQVHRVADKLSIRKFANAKSEIVAELPADGKGLIATGRTSGMWVEIEYGSKRGWVDARFIKTNAQAETAEVSKKEPVPPTTAMPPEAEEAIADCDSDDNERRLRGCGELIKRADLSDELRAIAYSRRSDSYIAKNEWDRAVEDRLAALKLEPKSDAARQRAAEAHRLRGNKRQAAEDTDGAIADYTEAIRFDANNVAAIAGRAAIYVRRNEIDAAIKDLTGAQQLDRGNETYRGLLANLYGKRADTALLQEKHDTAIEAYGEAIELSPRTASIYYRRALALTAREEHSRAISDLDDAIRLDDSLLDARRLRAQSAMALRRYRDAIGDFDVILNREPNNESALLARALAWESDGNADKALADYRSVLRLEAQNRSAKAGVRRLERAAADEKALRDVPEKARELLSKVQPFGPTRWNHNGSTMKLVAKGTRRRFYYERPRKGIRASGVRRGTLLFDGVREGFTYSGTARIFNSRCGTKTYAVSGSVSDDEETVTLLGRAPIVDSSCNLAGYRDDYLYFELKKQRDQLDDSKTSNKVSEQVGSSQYECCIRYKRRQGVARPQGACRNHLSMRRYNPSQAGVSDWCAL